MLISVSGIYRSASTVQFNLIRLALEMAGHKVNVWGEEYILRKCKDVDLVKIHKFKPYIAKNAEHIFLTDRVNHEIENSWRAFKGEEPNIELWRANLDMWKQYTNKMYHYSLWQEWPEKYAYRIVHDLCLDVDHEELLKEFDKIKLPDDGWDSKTLFFSNHVTNS